MNHVVKYGWSILDLCGCELRPYRGSTSEGVLFLHLIPTLILRSERRGRRGRRGVAPHFPGEEIQRMIYPAQGLIARS